MYIYVYIVNTLTEWQYSSQGIPLVRSAANGNTRSCTSMRLATGTGRKGSHSTEPAASDPGSAGVCARPTG